MDFFLFSQINPFKDCLVFTSLDKSIFNGLNNLAGKYLSLDTLAIFFAQYFEYILIFFLFLFLLFNFRKYRLMIVQAFLAAILARLVIVEVIRYFLPRSRPFLETLVNLLLAPVNQSSFPSGHAAFYFAISTVIFLYFKKVYPRPKFWWGIGFLFFLASFLISLARVFVGIHWPSDIVAGWLVGIFSGWLINKVFKNFQK